MNYRALLIGCGNIGAGYDFDTDAVLTHAKAYSLSNDIVFSVYDSDKVLAKKVAERYNVEYLNEISDAEFRKYEIISICTPTTTHYEYLLRAIKLNIPLIVCEKPVAAEERELQKLSSAYYSGKTKVLVNYIRRFQPAFVSLKEKMNETLANESLTNVVIQYQRGFLNNASHAFDLVEFLLGREICLDNIHISNKIMDAFPIDPTLNLTADWENVNFNVVGLSNIKFSLFEIDLFFEYHRISIKEAGNVIEIYQAHKGEVFFKPLEKQTTEASCLKDYMIPVIDAAKRILTGKQEDNFIASLTLASKMLNYIH